jgi:mRNA-degrading endonuclease RelE of RelBE toxin-antitoxin system
VVARLEDLKANPFLRGKHIKKLREMDRPTYRLRVDSPVGSFIVFYRFRGMTILVLRIIAKKDADRIIKGL